MSLNDDNCMLDENLQDDDILETLKYSKIILQVKCLHLLYLQLQTEQKCC